MNNRYIYIVLLLTLICSCSRKPTDPVLKRIAATACASPRLALAALDSIDYAGLSARNRHFYDFLTIKARDKAYINHTSDTAILALIDYYEGYDALYPEVLYYAGRVYSDMGDYPSALHYFHAALDKIPDSPEHYALRGAALSQTGRLLNILGLFNESIPCIHKVININKLCNDTTNIVYNLQLLSDTYIRAGKHYKAEPYLKEALALCNSLPESFAAKTNMYLAAIKYKSGEIDSALNLIRGTYHAVKPIARSSVLGYASRIYLSAGILDTAYLYSYTLIHSEDSRNRNIGYQVLLDPQLNDFIDIDSLKQYMADYKICLESLYNDREAQFAINEQNLYNYQLHKRKKEKAEEQANTLRHYIFGFIFLVIMLSAIILYLKNQNKNRIIELQQAIDNINKLKQELKAPSEGSLTVEDKIPTTENNSTENLRERLKQELIALFEQLKKRPSAAEPILQSNAYKKLQDHIANCKFMPENDPLWRELEQEVLSVSPKFKTSLNLLTSGKLTVSDYHTALLIKCGVRPSQMTKLFQRSNGAIISRRENLGIKLLDKKFNVKVIDDIILLL